MVIIAKTCTRGSGSNEHDTIMFKQRIMKLSLNWFVLAGLPIVITVIVVMTLFPHII